MQTTNLPRNSAALLVSCLLLSTAVQAEDQGWPREKVAADGTRIKIYQPQIDSWDRYVDLQFHMAVEVTPQGDERAVPAAVSVSAETTTDFGARAVMVYNAKLLDATFPSMDAETAKRLTQAIAAVIPASPMSVSLDRMLAYFEPAPDGLRPVETRQEQQRAIESSPEPPEILVSTRPAVVVLFDGAPIFAPIEDADLEVAVNSNWDVLKQVDDDRVYLLLEESWLAAAQVTGPWEPAGKLPVEFQKLPADEQWADVRQHIPGKEVAADDLPRVYVSYARAELIVINGDPELELVPGTQLQWVANTDSDLFRHDEDGYWYFLISGRWFRTRDLEAGGWSFATNALPQDFAKIPADHERAQVRASVPGTPEAEEAVNLASIPRTAEIKRDEATVTVVYAGDPEFTPIDGTTVSYAANTSFDVFRVGDLYYTCFQAAWFVSTTPNGPWVVTDAVPDEIYTVPPSSPKHHVTYVYVYDSSPNVVVYGYTSGYWGVYVSSGCVVYGTGYYYPPYYYYPSHYHYPVYYPYPYSYGVAAWYNPNTGMYGSGSAVYGPYGGYGWGNSYNPTTGTYARGVAAYGPYQAGRAAQAYNPRTDTYAAGYQRANPYQQWGETVVSRGDDWVHSGHYSDSRGTVAGFETSKGGSGAAVRTDNGSGFVVRDKNNNLYAGKDGNVYKNEGGSWSRYDDGNWSQLEQSEIDARKDQARQSSEQRSNTAGERPAVTPDPKATAQQRAADRGVDTAAASQRADQPRASRSSGQRSGTMDQLQRDQRARSRGSQRARDFSSWSSSRGGGRSLGGGRGGRGRRR